MYFIDKNRIKYFKTLIGTSPSQRKKALEAFYINLFLQTPKGLSWKGSAQLLDIPNQESPDFLFKTPNRQKKGIEIVDWLNDTKQCLVTKILVDIARDICTEVKEKLGINLSLIIDIYDPRKWAYRTRKEYLDYVYNPGVKRLQANTKTIKKHFLEAIFTKEEITENLIDKQLEINGQYFRLVFNKSWLNFPEFYINNNSTCWEDPIISLQKIIDNKNKKYKSYLSNCDSCDLLIVYPNYSTGNSIFSDTEVSFKSNFHNVFLLYWEAENISVTKLNTIHP